MSTTHKNTIEGWVEWATETAGITDEDRNNHELCQERINSELFQVLMHHELESEDDVSTLRELVRQLLWEGHEEHPHGYSETHPTLLAEKLSSLLSGATVEEAINAIGYDQ